MGPPCIFSYRLQWWGTCYLPFSESPSRLKPPQTGPVAVPGPCRCRYRTASHPLDRHPGSTLPTVCYLTHCLGRLVWTQDTRLPRCALHPVQPVHPKLPPFQCHCQVHPTLESPPLPSTAQSVFCGINPPPRLCQDVSDLDVLQLQRPGSSYLTLPHDTSLPDPFCRHTLFFLCCSCCTQRTKRTLCPTSRPPFTLCLLYLPPGIPTQQPQQSLPI